MKSELPNEKSSSPAITNDPIIVSEPEKFPGLISMEYIVDQVDTYLRSSTFNCSFPDGWLIGVVQGDLLSLFPSPGLGFNGPVSCQAPFDVEGPALMQCATCWVPLHPSFLRFLGCL